MVWPKPTIQFAAEVELKLDLYPALKVRLPLSEAKTAGQRMVLLVPAQAMVTVCHGADSPGRRPMMYGGQALKREGWHLVQSLAVCPVLNQEHSLQYALSQMPNPFHFGCLRELTFQTHFL